MRYIKVILVIVALVLLAGCANSIHQVSVDDPVKMVQDEERFQELDQYFKRTYKKGDEFRIQKDPLYDEWRSLDSLSQAGKNGVSIKGKVFSTVDLDNKTYTLDGEIYSYDEIGNEIIVNDSFEEIDDETIPKLIKAAKNEKRKDQEHNISILLKTLWIPIVLAGIGILSIIRPDIIWFFEGGYKYKDAEQSDMSSWVNITRGIIAIGLSLVVLYFIYRALIL